MKKAVIYIGICILLISSGAISSTDARKVVDTGIPSVADEKKEDDSTSIRSLEIDTLSKKHGDVLLVHLYDLGKEVAEVRNTYQRIAQAHEKTGDTVHTLEEFIQAIEQQLSQAQRQRENTADSIARTRDDIAQTQELISIKEEQLEGHRELVSVFFNELYREKGTSVVESLFGESSFGEALTTLHDLELLEQQGRDLYEQAVALTQDLASEYERLEKKEVQLQKLQEKLIETIQRIQEKKAQKEYLLAETQGSEERYENLRRKAREELLEAEEQLKEAQKRIEQVLDGENTNAFKRLAAQLRDGFSKENDDQLVWPVSPTRGITAHFDDAGYVSIFGRDHRALDIRAKQGTPIRAAQDGYVIAAEDNGFGYSYIVLVHSKELLTLYGHVSGFSVTEGDIVKRGDIIGKTGGRPGSRGAGRMTTGPHLHFEVHYKQEPADPLTFLSLP